MIRNGFRERERQKEKERTLEVIFLNLFKSIYFSFSESLAIEPRRKKRWREKAKSEEAGSRCKAFKTLYHKVHRRLTKSHTKETKEIVVFRLFYLLVNYNLLPATPKNFIFLFFILKKKNIFI
jgi:hypothetical protein